MKCGVGEGWSKISWTDRVRKEEVLPRVKEESKILLTTKRRRANWIGSHLTQELPSKTRYWLKCRRKYGSDVKMKTKT